MEKNYRVVEGHPDLIRDSKTHAIIKSKMQVHMKRQRNVLQLLKDKEMR